MSFFCDYEMPAFCNVRDIKKSRKEFKCCECGEQILIGSSYVYIIGKWDGDISSYHQHQECAEACRSVRDQQSGECIPFGYYIEWLGDCFSQRNKWDKRTRKALAVVCLKHKTIREFIKDWLLSEDV